MPLIEGIQEYIETAEDYVYTSFSSVKAEMPNIQEAVNRFWVDVSRFGPSIPEIRIPGLGEFQSIVEKATDWAAEHPWKVSGLSIGVLGLGLLVGYNVYQIKARPRLARRGHSSGHERRQVVVVLGADLEPARQLALALEKKGFIIIASVSVPEAVDELEHAGKGYVRALVLNPYEPAAIPIFLRSLAATLSQRFPINVHGDPHASPSAHPYIHSVVSYLSFHPGKMSTFAPLEHLQLQSDYIPFLTATHIVPLQIIQALLPLMRNSPSRTRDAVANGHGKRSIVVCVPLADARVGLPFSGTHSMAAVATLRAVEVLRREVRIAAMTGRSEGMGDINVVSVEVGVLDLPVDTRMVDAYHEEPTESWTPSEQMAYGTAYKATLTEERRQRILAETPKAEVFVDKVVEIVSFGRALTVSLFGFRLYLGPVFDWLRGNRYSVGAGVGLWSYVPGGLLDAFINTPYYIVSHHKGAEGTRVGVPPPAPGPAPAQVHSAAAPLPVAPAAAAPGPKEAVDSAQTSEHERDASENGSEADVESNDGAGVSESWVSLQARSTTSSSDATTA
ncbi:hypothetical protein BC834DRAFT_853716 [Gloeopeniophorella convolvens]|nr:hypothetical protein BC834DRAFT_853716 [Gloeopeniophorella convolvens]